MTIADRHAEMRGLVDPETAAVDRRIFSDQEIYEMELEQIFARAWNFICHESQIPNPGDFFMTFIGEDRVICVRDTEGNPQVLVNTCRHRGNAVCRAEEGHATSFMCTYHGWTYDLKGSLVGVPGFKEVYHEELDRENWGLIKANAVSYNGFVFACFDPEAPELYDYLGEVGRLSLDYLAVRGEMQVVGGVQKYTIPCNWKLAADNVWDYYHTTTTHASSIAARPTGNRNGMSTLQDPKRFTQPHVVVLGEYGHAISGYHVTPESDSLGAINARNDAWRETPEAKRVLGPVGGSHAGHPHVFPNMWITGNQISMRFPKGPTTTEIWWFTLLQKALSPEERKTKIEGANRAFGPAGMLEQEDGENWGESTKGAVGTTSRRWPLNYSMNLGLGTVIDDETGPPHMETRINEHAQLWLYRAWADWMGADGWAQLKADHTPVPRDTV